METTAEPARRRRRAVGALSALSLIGALVSWGAAAAAADSSGQGISSQGPPATIAVSPNEVATSATGPFTFTYTAAKDASLDDGTVTLTVPGGWTAPQTSDPAAPGFITSTANCGSVNCVPMVNSMTITISYIFLHAGKSFTITYGDATAPSSAATFDFMATETPAFDQSTVDLPAIPVTTCGDGAGVMTVSPQKVAVSTASSFTFTYTAAGCGLLPGGIVTVDVPGAWTPPSTAAGTPGYITVSAGTVTPSGSRITITNATLGPGESLTLSYAKAVPASPGYPVFYTSEQFGSGGTLTTLPSSPQITVVPAGSPPPTSAPPTSPGGPGGNHPTTGPTQSAVVAAMTVSPATVTASHRSTLSFTYMAPGGGLPPSGTVALTVPGGWTAPTRTPGAPGYTSASAGKASVSGRRITVTGATLPPRGTLTIVYHDGAAPRSPGQAEFKAQESLSGAARFSALAQSPVVTVAGTAGPGPSWLVPLLTAGLAAACATAAALGARLLRIRRSPLPPATRVAAVSRSGPPRVSAVDNTGNEPTFSVRIEAHPGTAVQRTEEVKP